MNHTNARLTPAGRLTMVERIGSGRAVANHLVPHRRRQGTMWGQVATTRDAMHAMTSETVQQAQEIPRKRNTQPTRESSAMLWQMRNFKGVGAASLDLAPGKTTVLTGVNSSGKSSVIQSILLIAQSLHSNGPVVLNGPLVRLGDAKDLVREGADSVSISIELNTASLGEVPITDDVHATYELVPTPDDTTLQPRKIQLMDMCDKSTPFVMEKANSRKSDVDIATRATSILGGRYALHVKSLLGSKNRQLRTYVVLQGLRPIAFVQILEPEEIAYRYRRAVEVFLKEVSQRRPSYMTSARANQNTMVREFIKLITTAAQAADESTRALVAPFEMLRSGAIFPFNEAVARLSDVERARIVNLASEQRQKEAFIVLPVLDGGSAYRTLPGGLLEAAFEESLGDTYTAMCLLKRTLDSVAGRAQYLGPLRDEPRVVWNHWNELARGLPVGTRGEYSAAVLSRSKSATIQYVTPQGIEKRATLGEAVDEWLEYLEIGTGVAARSHGKLGVGLDLSVGGKVRDLTAVGVGVSQALPLLVGLLAAPEGSLFIIEQPELHLHPAVQARLADFMLKARPDIAIVVETHSDSFVTRIRRRVAERQIDPIEVDIAFIEPGDGGSTARRLELSKFGDLSDWPKGFLSSAEEDVRAIIGANIARAKEKNNAE